MAFNSFVPFIVKGRKGKKKLQSHVKAIPKFAPYIIILILNTSQKLSSSSSELH